MKSPRPSKPARGRFFRAAALAFALFTAAGCVATKDGKKKFDPWKAAVNTDEKIDDWLENKGYPTWRHSGD